MIEYQKIESLYKFDGEIKRFIPEFYNPIVEYLAPLEWLGTEKIDGTNIRIHWNGKSFEIGGRTDNAEIPKAVQQVFNDKFNYDMEVQFEQKFGNKDVYLFCEAYGGKIQNGAYSCETKLIGFDIMINSVYLDRNVAQSIFASLGIDYVPTMTFENLAEAIAFVKINEKSIQCPDDKMEGIVCVPKQRIYDHQGNRIIVKIKKKDLDKLI